MLLALQLAIVSAHNSAALSFCLLSGQSLQCHPAQVHRGRQWWVGCYCVALPRRPAAALFWACAGECQCFFLRATRRISSILRRFLKVFKRYTKLRGVPCVVRARQEIFGEYPVSLLSFGWSPRDQVLSPSKLALLPFCYRPFRKHSRTCDLGTKPQKIPVQSPFSSVWEPLWKQPKFWPFWGEGLRYTLFLLEHPV